MQEKTAGLLALFGCVILSLACSLSAPTPVAWVGTPTAAARAKTQTAFASTKSAEMTAMPTLPPTRTATPYIRTITPMFTHAEDGPWLIYPGRDGTSLHALDMDTGTDVLLDLPPLVSLDDLVDGLSPDGGQLLLRAGQVEVLDELALYALENPHKGASQVSPLLSVLLQRDIISSAGKRAPQALLAVCEEHGIAWTKDGQFAAFTAALDGDSSDIYLYDPAKATAERMTVRYRQNLTPFWSPDNAWLIFQEAVTITSEGAWEITAVSDVSMPHYATTRFLYMPPVGSLGDVMVGWLNDKIFLSYSRGPEGFYNLRQVDLERGKETIVFEGHFSSLAFDPDNKMIALNIDTEDAQANGMYPGIYLSTSGGSPFTQMFSGDFTSLAWSSEGRMFLAAGGRGISGFDAGGSRLTLPNESGLVFSQGQSWLIAWNDANDRPGVRLYTAQGSLLQNVSDIKVSDVIWQPDSKGFYLVSAEGLYQVRFPLLKPVLISTDVYQGEDFHAAWLSGR
jgi:hypothetical protein